MTQPVSTDTDKQSSDINSLLTLDGKIEVGFKMLDKVIKRNGKTDKFDSKKILSVILKAGEATGEFNEKTAQLLAMKVVNLVKETMANHIPTVEEVQDAVEEVLLSSRYKKTAKAFILYRDQRTKMREFASKLNIDLVDEYISKLDWQVNENSNMSYSLQGLNNYLTTEISKVYWLSKVYPKEIREAHQKGDFHIHDLGLLSVYCVGWDLFDLLCEGFTGVPGKISSKPPKHFRSALGQIVNFFYTLQGEAAGAQAFSNFDTYLAPFIKFDKLNYCEIKQALQEFVFNINVPTRVGFQTPFTNVTIDLNCPKHIKDVPVVIGGQMQKETYGEFQHEMNLFNKALLEVLLEGDASGRIFAFPIPTFNITKDFDWGNPNLKIIWEVTAKYGFAYFANFINANLNPEDVRSMCCRLRIDNRELHNKGGGLFGSAPLTGSIGVVTINLPRIGHQAKDKEDFFKRLKHIMALGRESLEIKRKVLEKLTDDNLYPYVKFYLRRMKAKTHAYWKNHFSTIGVVGMNECCLNFLKKDIGSPEGKKFAEEVLDSMRTELELFQGATGNMYNLEATPAEGTCYRLARLDKENHTDCNFASGDEVPFYTNSTQLPVNYTDDIWEVISHQENLQTKYTGGTVVHTFVGEKIIDPEATKQFIKRVFEMTKIPYLTITPTFSICPVHGYISGEHKYCPECDKDILENKKR